jgi:NAD(P)-dependent dehydrogenase (short-subunit alcohol dehydrogenase family)
MNGAVLITGKQSGFTDDLVQETLNRHIPVCATHDSQDTAPEVPDSSGDRLFYTPWSRRSLLSARSVLLTVAREYESLGHGFVVCSPEGVNEALHQTESAVIEEKIDVAVKGYLFILKELIAYLMRRGGGDCTIVWYDPGSEVMPPLDAGIAGAVQGLVRSLLASYEDSPVTIRGLFASDADSRGVARWVLEQSLDRPEKSAQRWQKYGQKGILPFRR